MKTAPASRMAGPSRAAMAPVAKIGFDDVSRSVAWRPTGDTQQAASLPGKCYRTSRSSMWGYRSDDVHAFRREALAHVDALHGFARYLAGGEGDADDLVQETYARALAAAGQFSPGTNLKAWLYRILRNIFIDRRRRAGGPMSSLSLDDVDESVLATPPRGAIDVDAVTSTDVESAMMALPEAHRTVILLDLEGLNENETAVILDCAPGTVKSRLFRARAALRELLKDYAPVRRLHGL
jgi:RNA polymerase sigma-70 factor, ECF subfamily